MEYFSTIPLLFLTQTILIIAAARKANVVGAYRPIFRLLIALTGWGVLVTELASTGAFQTDAFLASYPLLWFPFIPVAIVLFPMIFSITTRKAIHAAIDAAPIAWLVGVHSLRILAIGTMIKAVRGDFSMSFAIYVGGPDILFGLSAVPMAWLALRGRVGNRALVLWHFVGFLVIIPTAPVVGQMGLPGVFFRTVETPTMATLFEYPMILAPALVVPLFVMMNLFVAIRVIERALQTRQTGLAG